MLGEIESLYRERFRDFTRAAAGITGDEETGQDAVQDAFAKLVRKRRRYRGEGSLEAWVWRFVVNAARDARARCPRAPDAPDQVAARADDLGLPLELLTDRQRFLHYYADLDYTTIASASGTSPGTVGATLSTSWQTLQGALTKEMCE